MLEPPEVKHAMEVAKKQSNVSSPCSHSQGARWASGSQIGAYWCKLGWFHWVVFLISLSGSLKNRVILKISLALIKWLLVLDEDFFKDSISPTWVNIFFSPNKGRIQKRCQRKPALHHGGWSARHQEGHAGGQTGQWGKYVVKVYLLPRGHGHQVVQGTHLLECIAHFGFLWFRWSTEPSTARKAVMG